MDLSKLAQEETHFDDPVEVTLYDDAGEPELDSAGNEVKVWVVSEYAKPVRRVTRQNQTKIVQLSRRYGSIEMIPSAEMDALGVARIAAHLTQWQGFESGGKPLPFSSENAAAVIAGLQKHRPKQLAQIEGAIAAHASFFTKASANSSST